MAVSLNTLAGRLEASKGLDVLADKVQGALSRLPLNAGMRSTLSGTWLGHPVHPLLVATPIGAWTSAALLDLFGERRAARTLIGAGVVSVLPAALTGASDWLDTSGSERRIGAAHFASNMAAAAAYGGSWALRRRYYRSGVALSMVGAGAATFSGWLGGHLAYAMGVGVDTNAFNVADIDWTPINVKVSQDTLVGASAGASPLVVTRSSSSVHAIGGRCSHRGAPLSEGKLADNCVTCPWHASRFDMATGQVVAGPAVAPQPVYETRERDAGIEVRRHEERALRTNSVQVTPA